MSIPDVIDFGVWSYQIKKGGIKRNEVGAIEVDIAVTMSVNGHISSTTTSYALWRSVSVTLACQGGENTRS